MDIICCRIMDVNIKYSLKCPLSDNFDRSMACPARILTSMTGLFSFDFTHNSLTGSFVTQDLTSC